MLIIGYGNPLRGDDGVGPAAACRLRALGFDALCVHQLTPELAEAVAAAPEVIFLDADTTLTPGEISLKPVAAAENAIGHSAAPSGLLHLARAVYGSAPRAWILGMGGESFALREGLSPGAERAVARAVEKIAAR